jgi:endonuclease YncB( thermonuclease family)
MRIHPIAFLFLPTIFVVSLWYLKHYSVGNLVLRDQQASSSTAAVALVTHVVDGDTFDIGNRRVRIWGIDAPEAGQKCYTESDFWMCGQAATSELEKIILGKSVDCEVKDRDRNGRDVSLCIVAGVDVAEHLVKSGWAVDWPKYSNGYYAEFEDSARRQQLGIYRQ